MKKIRDFFKEYWFYVSALLVPWVVLIIRSIIADTWITGNGSILRGDTLAQLLPMCYELWNKVHDGESLMYTWNVAGGSDFHAIAGYFYSPFTLILLAVPKTWLPYAMQFVMMMKWALSAVSMTYFFYHTRYNQLIYHKKLVSMFLGLAFCLGNGMIWFMTYIQFNDVMICFPILLLLIEKMVFEKKWKLYYIILAFCIISNSYITFEVCIFLVFWFVFQFQRDTKEKFQKFLIFAGSSVLAAMTAVAANLPIIVTAQDRLEVTDSSGVESYSAALLIKISTFIQQFFIFQDITPPIEMQPNVFCSIILAVLSLLFMFSKVGNKRKIYMSVVMIFLIISFFNGKISLLWHLFNIPNGVYHRFSNIFVFWVLFLALYVIRDLAGIRLRYIILVWIGVCGSVVYTFFDIEKYDSYIIYLTSALLIVLYFMLLVLHRRKSIRYSNMVIVIVVFGMLELCMNAYNAMGFNDGDNEYIKGGNCYEAVQLLQQTDDLEKGERLAGMHPITNISLVVGKESSSGFLSAINGRMQRLYSGLGMVCNGYVEYGLLGASPLINLMFNVKYGLGSGDMEFSDCEKIAQNEYATLYKMKRQAGLGYMVNDDILEWKAGGQDWFSVQNRFVELTTGGDDIFTILKQDINATDVKGQSIERREGTEQEALYIYDVQRMTGTAYDAVQLEFIMEENMDLYMVSNCASYNKISIFFDDVLQYSANREQMLSTFHIGNVKKNQKITIIAIPAFENKDVKETISFMFAKFNEEVYGKAYEKLSKNIYQIEQMESDYIKGSIVADETGIMMSSVQAVDGFTVYVDGKEVSYETIGGALIGVPLEAGEHTVEFRYRTPYLNLGRSISCCAIAVFVLLCIIDWRRKKGQLDTDEMNEVAVG